MIGTHEELVEAVIHHDLIELEELILFSENLEEKRERMKVLVNRLAYLVIEEG